MVNKTCKVKVCGMKDADNIAALSGLAIDYMGFIFYEKSTRYTDTVPEVSIPNNIKKVGVFVNAAEALIHTKIDLGLHAVQLHGTEPPTLCRALRNRGVKVIKAFGIHDRFNWSSLEAYQDDVDYFLFDTDSAQYGGTGQTLDWEILANYPLPTAYFLSGGLSPANVADTLAIADERLVGLDLNSRFEIAPGIKDIEKLNEALKIIKHE